jgi:hypothetical protein
MLKYLETVKDRLSGLKAGISNNAAAWAGQSDTLATVQAEIAALENLDSQIELLKDQLKQKQTEARNLAEEKNAVALVIEKKAISIHATSGASWWNTTSAPLRKGPGLRTRCPRKPSSKALAMTRMASVSD